MWRQVHKEKGNWGADSKEWERWASGERPADRMPHLEGFLVLTAKAKYVTPAVQMGPRAWPLPPSLGHSASLVRLAKAGALGCEA